MAVNESLAQVSDQVFSASIATYSLAMVAYCGEYAFGRHGRIAKTSGAAPPATVAAAGNTAVLVRETAVRGGGGDAAPKQQLGGRLGRIGVALTGLALLMQVGSLVARGVATGRLPWGNMFEFAAVIAAVTVTAFLVVLVRQPALRYLGGFVLIPVVLILVLAGLDLYAEAKPLVPPLRSYWLAIHVTTASIATGIFTLSLVATVLYLVRARYDRISAAVESAAEPAAEDGDAVDVASSAPAGSVATTTGRTRSGLAARLGPRLPDAEVLDRLAYRTIAFAFPIWTFAVIAGAIWAESAWGRFWGWDPKETWAFISWIVYAGYLHARATAGWRGSKAAWINIAAAGTMVFNFVVVNVFISGLHSYSGL